MTKIDFQLELNRAEHCELADRDWLDLLRDVLQVKFVCLRDKTLSGAISDRLSGVAPWPLRLWLVWSPNKMPYLKVHYRVPFAFYENSREFEFGELGISIETSGRAPTEELVEELLDRGLARRSGGDYRPDPSLRHAVTPDPEQLLVPISYDGTLLRLAFSKASALSAWLHPHYYGARKEYVWVDEERLLQSAESVFDRLEEPLDNTLFVSDVRPRPANQLEFRWDDFPDFPPALALGGLGLTSYVSRELESAELGPEGLRLTYEGCRSALHVEEIVIFSNGIGFNGYTFFDVPSLEWQALRKMAQERTVWSPGHFVNSYTGTTWTLEWWNPPEYRIMKSIVPPAGTFWELYCSVLELSGFEFFFPFHDFER